MLEALFEKHKDVQFGAPGEPKCLDFVINYLTPSIDMDGVRFVDRIEQECRARKIPFRIWIKDGSAFNLHPTSQQLEVDPANDPLFLVLAKDGSDNTAMFFSMDGALSRAFEGSCSGEEKLISRKRFGLSQDSWILDSSCDIEFVVCHGHKELHFGAYDIPKVADTDGNKYSTYNRPVVHHERSIRAKLIKGLEEYIKRIDDYKKTDGEEKGYEHGFLFFFFRHSRGINRKANYLLAKDCLGRLKEGKAIQDIFSDADIVKTRSQKLREIGLKDKALDSHIKDGINSSELNAVINVASGYMKEHGLVSSVPDFHQ